MTAHLKYRGGIEPAAKFPSGNEYRRWRGAGEPADGTSAKRIVVLSGCGRDADPVAESVPTNQHYKDRGGLEPSAKELTTVPGGVYRRWRGACEPLDGERINRDVDLSGAGLHPSIDMSGVKSAGSIDYLEDQTGDFILGQNGDKIDIRTLRRGISLTGVFNS